MKSVIGFVLGAAAGSLLTYKLVEEKYRQIANDEIESVREHYRSKEKLAEFVDDADRVVYAHKDISNSIKTNEDDSNKVEYKEKVNDLGYSNEEHEVWMEPGVDIIEPFIIRPEEYGDTDYEMKSLTYYADFVLADNEDDEIISEPESIIGDALSHFGEYETDAVHVRNVNNECDYEILKHEKTFSEVVGGQK